MDYQQALDYIYGFVNYETLPMPRSPEHFDLRRMDELMLQLGNPHKMAKSVHITGTKGKGSTAAMVASVLTASGYTTGLYTSPHLIDLRERIQVNGEPISVDELITLVHDLKADIEAVNDRATYGKLTTFEVLTALAFAYFARKHVEIQVLEVGLGGRLDATNVIESPEVCVITNIGFDHVEVLGNTLARIAAEKSGIIKPGCTVVTSAQNEEAVGVIEKVCLERGVKLIRVGRDVTWQPVSHDLDGQTTDITGRLGSYRLFLPLLGEHQTENAATALAALEVLVERGIKISRDNILYGMAKVRWPGRFQILRRHPLVLVDGAHNTGSVDKLKLALEQYFALPVPGNMKSNTVQRVEKAILVFGASGDKDVSGVIALLIPLFDKVIATASRNPRAMPAAHVRAEFARCGVEAQVANDVKTAITTALSMAGKDDLICITGSLFVVAEAIEHFDTVPGH